MTVEYSATLDPWHIKSGRVVADVYLAVNKKTVKINLGY